MSNFQKIYSVAPNEVVGYSGEDSESLFLLCFVTLLIVHFHITLTSPTLRLTTNLTNGTGFNSNAYFLRRQIQKKKDTISA
jgi:hypothetical protein